MSDEHFIQQKNVEDVKTHAIEMAMCMGNLKARQTCRIKGAYGCGVPVVLYERETEEWYVIKNA